MLPPFYARILDTECRYDIILGRDQIANTGIVLDVSKRTASWDDTNIEFKTDEQLEQLSMDTLQHLEESDDFELYQSEIHIKQRKYSKVEPEDVIAEQHHMNDGQKKQFLKILSTHKTVFDGVLGRYPHRKITIELIDGAKPIHKRAYAVPRKNLQVFKHELDNLVKDGVLKQVGCSAWGFPTFIIFLTGRTRPMGIRLSRA